MSARRRTVWVVESSDGRYTWEVCWTRREARDAARWQNQRLDGNDTVPRYIVRRGTLEVQTT